MRTDQTEVDCAECRCKVKTMTGQCMFRPKKIGKGFRMEAINGSDGGEMGGQN